MNRTHFTFLIAWFFFFAQTAGAITLKSQPTVLKVAAANPGGSADWNSRISGSGVVWYHNFDLAAEVNAFRWTGGYGNDPQAVGTAIASRTSWVATGGADGGSYLRINRPAGTSEVPDWWRPFSPLTGASNGRGIDDPGAGGTLVPQVFNSTNKNETGEWQKKAKPGWYGHSSYQNSFFDGTDFYLQVRVKTDPRRIAAGNYNGGKKVWFTTTSNSYTSQELVTVGQYHYTLGNGAGIANYHHVYQGYNYASLQDVAVPTVSGTNTQIGSEILGTCDPYTRNVSGCWSYSGGWDTLLYHITPGRNGVAETKFEVWAAHEGETKYTKIWDMVYPAHFDEGSSSTGAPFRNGWNALILSAYSNGFAGVPLTEFNESYDQVIFSKQFIPCPK
ncbi:MAG: hypothetical protein AB7N80_15060 [Bdellovibrionales bacterium]